MRENMSQWIKPDFNNSIVNLSSTLAESLGCPNGKPTLPALSRQLSAGYKNIVLLVLDGLGMYPISRNLEEGSFLRRNLKRELTSVFPSTTTNATTSLETALFPMEHGWFGWSLYFEELQRAVDLFSDVDSATGEPLHLGYARRVLPTTPFYRKIGQYTANVVVPPFWREEENRYPYGDMFEMKTQIERVCKKKGKQFIYAYCPEPDSTMHRHGVSSEEAKKVICALDGLVEELAAALSDTLVIVTADHGQVDIGGQFEVYRDGELCSLLKWRPYLEARAAAFKVKEGEKRAFEELFEEKYGADFALTPVERLIGENYFGCAANQNAKLLGDYIAIATTDKIMKLTPRSHDFKGHHASLTEEMLVPLIWFET